MPIFALLQTTELETTSNTLGLWLAKKCLSLHYCKQPLMRFLYPQHSCD